MQGAEEEINSAEINPEATGNAQANSINMDGIVNVSAHRQ